MCLKIIFMILQKIRGSLLVKNTALYTIINVLDKAIPFLIMPILSRVLTKDEMGYYSLFQVTFSILLPILTCSIDFAMSIVYFKMGKNDFAKYQSTGVFITLLLFSALTLCSIPIRRHLGLIFGLDGKWLFVVYAITILQFFNQLRMSLWQAQEKPICYGLFALPFSLIKYLVALYLILVCNFGWEGIIIGYLTGEVLFAGIAIISLIHDKYLVFSFSYQYIKDIFKVSFPITIHKISSWFSTSINRLIINSLLGAAATGDFGIGSTFGTIVTVLEDAINKAYWPYLYKKLSNFNYDNARGVVKLIYLYYVLFTILGVIIGFVGYFGVGIIFGDIYNSTKNFILPLILSAIINGLYKLHVNIIFFSEKTFIVARNTIICAVVNVITSFIFVKYFGLLGAAYSSIIVQIVLYILTLIYSNRLYKLPWRNTKLK